MREKINWGKRTGGKSRKTVRTVREGKRVRNTTKKYTKAGEREREMERKAFWDIKVWKRGREREKANKQNRNKQREREKMCNFGNTNLKLASSDQNSIFGQKETRKNFRKK